MKSPSAALAILTLFANYGVRKTSMGDIAKAADVSRQSVYNQFGSKDAVLDWAISTFLDGVIETVTADLQSPHGSIEDKLAKAFQTWTGDCVPLLRDTQHGAEILDAATASLARSTRDYEREFNEALIDFLSGAGAVKSAREAGELVFVLAMASKGLLLKSESSESYAAGMKRVIAVVFDEAL